MQVACQRTPQVSPVRVMLKLATLLDNPAEPGVQSIYHDPSHLKAMGYNAQVLYATTAFSGIEQIETTRDAEVRRWLGHTADIIDERCSKAQQAGLGNYLFYDALVLPRMVVDMDPNRLTCRKRKDMLCPGSSEAWDLSIAGCRAMLQRHRDADGIVLRLGDTDASRMPHLVGNDIYQPHCPRCAAIGRAERLIAAIELFYDLVVRDLGKRLIVRAWNVRPGGMHDDPELANRVAESLPGSPDDDRLVLSFKFTHTDFWRYQQWNPASLRCGDRPVIYELQCQREFEAKGAIPNWQAPLWQQGPSPEEITNNQATRVRGQSKPIEPDHQAPIAGLAEVQKNVNLAGLWAWVRGGGWGGPFIREESWVDANVTLVPQLADNPELDTDAAAMVWVKDRLPVDDDAAAGVVEVLKASTEVVRKAMYVRPYAIKRQDPWHPAGDWIQDDLLDVRAAVRMIQQLDDQQLDEAIQEKIDAAEQATHLRRLCQQRFGERADPRVEPLISSLLYGESLIETLRDLVSGLAHHVRHRRQKSPATAELARKHMFEAQSHWNHHTQRIATLPGAATAFREDGFWDTTDQIMMDLA